MKLFKQVGEIIKAGALALALVVMAGPALSAEGGSYPVGATVPTGAYCNFDNDEVFDKIIDKIEENGPQAYIALMNSDAPCYDVRFHSALGVSVIGVELVEYIRTISYDAGDGKTFHAEFWKLKDVSGGFGYTWLPVGGWDEYNEQKELEESSDPI